ncbi:flagellar type III secretion system protein FlhB [Rhodobacter capsulatus]|uniref:flagellar type III secretion system protein FlhB n=1 Tax=Rhodobacter capsulatus TaxID=1061 RepID=UPI0003D3A665|nr:flagellar type III secretion system protein FlhB [Rhodobacter capsulatus]ETD88108.1 flagellar biosynthesis protein FlhB [Rhodobacter capsulatus YW2]
MSEEDDSSKEFDPTPQKIEQARKQGDLVKSTEVTGAAVYAAIVITALAFGKSSLESFGTWASVLIDQADSISVQLLGGGTVVAGNILGRMALTVAPWLLLPGVLVLAALAAQRAIVFAPEKLMPKFNRIDPIANFKQKFGSTGLFEFAKSFVKLVVISIILGNFMLRELPAILLSQKFEATVVAVSFPQMIVEFLLLMLLLAGVIAAIDYLWQRFDFLRRNKMTRKELTDEMKQSEGDPHIKAQRRQKAIEIATKQMIADVAKADVVIVNPTHYAVALKWERGAKRAPLCVAKGVDEVAARIREVAAEAGVPIHSDPPTARALYAAVDIGQEIHPDHYRPVAAAIRFAEKMRRRSRERGARK